MTARAVKCNCGHPACKDWHVGPHADVHGVKFTKEEAEAVAGFLNMLEQQKKVRLIGGKTHTQIVEEAIEIGVRHGMDKARLSIKGKPIYAMIFPKEWRDIVGSVIDSLVQASAVGQFARDRMFKHKKRQSIERMICHAEVQAEGIIREGDNLVIYQSESNHKCWARPDYEFDDGRFEEIT